MNVTDDPGIRDALAFLMTRAEAHRKAFEKALYAIEPNSPPGRKESADKSSTMSQGEADAEGPRKSGA
jgi:Mn-containing catalase